MNTEIQKLIDNYPDDKSIWDTEEKIANLLHEVRRCPKEDAIKTIAALRIIANHWEGDLADDEWDLTEWDKDNSDTKTKPS